MPKPKLRVSASRPYRLIVPIVMFSVAVVVVSLISSRWFDRNSDGTIRISGNIEMTEVKVAFKTSGRLTERNFDEGDAVEQGEEVARLDQQQLLRQRDQAQAALDAAKSLLAQSQTAIEFQRETVGGQIASADAGLRQAAAQLAELVAGSRTQEIQQAEARLQEASTEFERAQSDWQRAQTLMESDDIARSQYDQFRARFESARAQVRQAEEAVALVREGPRTETIDRASAAVEQARAAVKIAEAQRLELRRREQEVETRKAELERAAAQLAFVESQLGDTVATAPVSGVVLAESAEVGEVLAAGTTVLTIGNTAQPWLRGYISETDLGRVKIGQPVRVTTDSFPGKIYDGRLSFIASEAEFTPKQIQTEEERVKLVYRVKIDIDNPAHELKLNMPADAEIVVEE